MLAIIIKLVYSNFFCKHWYLFVQTAGRKKGRALPGRLHGLMAISTFCQNLFYIYDTISFICMTMFGIGELAYMLGWGY